MLTISAPCPRCLRPEVLFTMIHPDAPDVQRVGATQRQVIFKCVSCHGWVIALILAPANYSFSGAGAHSGDIEKAAPLILKQILPPIPSSSVPDGLPENIARPFLDGIKNLEHGMFTPGAGCFRTAIDRATKDLWASSGTPDAVPFKLDVRLKRLKETLDLPATVLDWADSVRVVGNEMHELDEISETDARDAQRFADIFLTYVYTLPKRLADFKERRSDAHQGP